MLILASTSDKIQLITAQAVNVDVYAAWMDWNGTVATPGRLNSKITTATTTDVVGSPGSSVYRNVKKLMMQNVHASSSVGITVQHTDGTNVIVFESLTLLAGEKLVYDEGVGFTLFDATGIPKANALAIASSAGQILALLAATVNNSTTTAAKITGLDKTVGIGTWLFEYFVRYQSGTAGTGIKWSVNHTGTVSWMVYNAHLVSANTGTADAAADQDVLLTTGGLYNTWAARAKSAAATMISASVDTVNVDMFLKIEGIMQVTAGGNIELYHASETAVQTSIMLGSALRLTLVG